LARAACEAGVKVHQARRRVPVRLLANLNAVAEVATDAIEIAAACLPNVARSAAAPTAVDIGFEAVFPMIGAAIADADQLDGVASIRRAIS